MINDVDPWESARYKFSTKILPTLERVGKSIGDASKNGNELASKIIKLYTQLHRSFDPVTCYLLEESLNEYLKENPDAKSK